MLQVIKAEEVRDGEPRWWLADEDRRLDYMKPEHLHLHPRSCAETTHAIVDRPAPTPTPAPGLDLDALQRAERAMTPGPWSMRRESHFVQIRAADLEELATTEQARGVDVANAAGIVALRNAASALIAEVRRLRAQVDADRRAYLDVCDAIARETSGPADAAAKVRALRAKLAEAKRLADDALLIAEHEPTCAIGPDGQDADCNCRRAAIAAALEAL